MSTRIEPDQQSATWLLAAIASLAVAALFGLSLLAFAVYALLGVIVLSRYRARTWTRNVTGRRELSCQLARIGETVGVRVSVRNRGPLPIVWLLIEDLLPRTACVHDPPKLRVRQRRRAPWMLNGQASKTLYYQLQCNRRGYDQIGPLIAETGDLFGLHRRYRAVVPPPVPHGPPTHDPAERLRDRDAADRIRR